MKTKRFLALFLMLAIVIVMSPIIAVHVYASETDDTVTFVEFKDSSYSSEMDGEYFIFVGFKDDKAYVMGNATNADGSREAVEIPVKPNGAIDADPETAEFFSFEFNVDGGGYTFSPDGKYMSMKDGKIITYDKNRVGETDLPRPVMFTCGGYYDRIGYFFNWTVDEYIIFDADTLTFKVSDTYSDTIVRYKQVCAHTNIEHIPGTPATCTQQGALEYWYCDECYGYYQNNDFDVPIMPEDEWGYVSEEMFTLPALGHKYDDDGVCENCSMIRPVYKPVTSLELFDQLSEDASYIIVFKDGDKAYAAFVPFNVKTPYDVDDNEDGIADILTVDANENEVPDCIEEYFKDWGYGDPFEDGIYGDQNENGVLDAEDFKLAVGDYNEDDVIDMNDYVLFFADYYEEFADDYRFSLPNFVEVTIEDDGSITIIDEGAMEFQLMKAGVWGSQIYDDEMFEYDCEHYGIKETDRMRAMWIPNLWIASDGMLGYYSEGHFMSQNRIYGDNEYPGILDNKNWKISFNDDGTVNLVCSWESLHDSGALQFVKYGDGKMTIVGLPDTLWEESDIMKSATEKISAYLYASEAVYSVPPHVCEFGKWADDNNGETHTRICIDPSCDESETLPHNWNGGVQSGTTTCLTGVTTTYTCVDCGAINSQTADGLGHDWSDWTDDGANATADTHSRICKRGCGVAAEIQNHDWSDWVSDGNSNHKKQCSVCDGARTAAHNWDNGAETVPATCYSTGITTYTCVDCDFSKTEVAEKLDHTFYDWAPDGDKNHVHECLIEDCGYKDVLPHDWDNGVVTTPSTTEQEGVKTYTCMLCSHTKTESIPKRVNNVSDVQSGITLEVPANGNTFIPFGTVIDVVEKDVDEVSERVLGEIELKLEGAAKPLACYDLELLLDGVEIQPDGTVNITLPALQQDYDYDKVVVVYIAPDGSYEECPTTINDDGSITFQTNHFSKYAVIGISNGLGTGAIVGIVVGSIVVLAVGVFALLWFVVYKKSWSDLIAKFKK